MLPDIPICLEEAMMHVDTVTLTLRNILFFQLLAVSVLAGSAPAVQQELLKIWKTLNTPLLPTRSSRTNHKSNKFWEIDMTKFEP
jgi:hypothetical protein